MKKGWLIGCGVAFVLVLLVCGGGVAFLVYGVFKLTQPVVDASDDFLAKLGQDKVSEAYAATSSGFHEGMDETAFAAAARKLGLTDFASASWTVRNINNNEGRVEGTVTSKQGANTRATIRLIYEQGAWKVNGVTYGGEDLVKPAAPE